MKPTKDIAWLQDTILGAAFLFKQLDFSDESDGFRVQVKQFLSDASKVEQTILARKAKLYLEQRHQHEMS